MIILFPLAVFAQATTCSRNGYSIMTINGIFTDKDGAISNRDNLKRHLPPTHNDQPLTIDYLPNPSHLGGLGDLAMSVYQKVFEDETVQDYDLIEMWKTASEKVATQKLLLIAHSQGNFYANSLYDSLSNKTGGVPKQSLAVYSVATPSSRVAGNGLWLTSDTDKVIAGLVGHLSSKKIMKPNTNIEFEKSDDPLGHDFTEVYLKYRADKIISDIQTSLDSLMVNGSQDALKPCISPPELTLAHKVEGKILAVVDPAANETVVAVKTVAVGTYEVGLALGTAVKQTVSTLGSFANSAMKSLTTKATGTSQAGTAALAVNNNQQITDNQQSINLQPTNNDLQVIPQKVSANENLGGNVNNNQEVNAPEPPLAALAENPSPSPSVSITTPSPAPVFSFSPGFGGGAPPPSAAQAAAPLTCADASATNLGGSLPCSYPPSAPVITSPSNFSQTFATTTITFLGTSSSSFIISNSLTTATTSADSSGNWSLTFRNLSQGTTTVNFYATDQNNSTSSPTAVSFSVDTAAPTASITYSDSDGIVKQGDILIITATFSEPMSDNPISKIAIAGGNILTAANMTKSSTTAYTYSHTVLAGDGAATVALSVGADVAGNIITTAPASGATFTVDNTAPTAPTLTISECSNTLVSGSCTTYATALHFTWTAGSADVTNYGIFKNGTLLATSSVNNYTATVSSDPNPFSFEITAYDNALNTATSTAQSIKVITLPSIGFYCTPYSTAFVEGGSYNPTITKPFTFLNCTFLSLSLSGARYGVIYKGTVGNSRTLMATNRTGSSNYNQLLNVNPNDFVNGDNYFTTIYDDNIPTNSAAFDRYFSTGANPPPNLNYGLINWKYDSAAP